MKQSETLILGIGNTLLSDEGAGIHALNHLQARLQSNNKSANTKSGISSYPNTENPNTETLTFIDGGTLSFTLAVWIEDCDNLIVFDATELHQPPGTVKTFIGRAMDEFLGNSKCSAHEVGLLDLMDIARITDHLPKQRALIGIQPDFMGWGMEPTAAVQKALDKAADEATALINLWQADTDDLTSDLTDLDKQVSGKHISDKTAATQPNFDTSSDDLFALTKEPQTQTTT